MNKQKQGRACTANAKHPTRPTPISTAHQARKLATQACHTRHQSMPCLTHLGVCTGQSSSESHTQEQGEDSQGGQCTQRHPTCGSQVALDFRACPHPVVFGSAGQQSALVRPVASLDGCGGCSAVHVRKHRLHLSFIPTQPRASEHVQRAAEAVSQSIPSPTLHCHSSRHRPGSIRAPAKGTCERLPATRPSRRNTPALARHARGSHSLLQHAQGPTRWHTRGDHKLKRGQEHTRKVERQRGIGPVRTTASAPSTVGSACMTRAAVPSRPPSLHTPNKWMTPTKSAAPHREVNKTMRGREPRRRAATPHSEASCTTAVAEMVTPHAVEWA